MKGIIKYSSNGTLEIHLDCLEEKEHLDFAKSLWMVDSFQGFELGRPFILSSSSKDNEVWNKIKNGLNLTAPLKIPIAD